MAERNKNVTIQTGIREYASSEVTKYALFLGGTNVTHNALKQYDPLIGGFERLFMVTKPMNLAMTIPDKLTKFKHILEYGHTAISGLGDIDVEFANYQGGYNGKQFQIPTHASDQTNSFSVTVYEFSGSPVREVLHSWINQTTDLQVGLTHYNGIATSKAANNKLLVSQANHTAEFIYMITDRTGMDVEYACLIANAFPRGLTTSVFNSQNGQHELIELTIEFTATKYESLQINQVAKNLLAKHQIITNSMNFNSQVNSENKGPSDLDSVHYDFKTGDIVKGDAETDHTMPVALPSTAFSQK